MAGHQKQLVGASKRIMPPVLQCIKGKILQNSLLLLFPHKRRLLVWWKKRLRRFMSQPKKRRRIALTGESLVTRWRRQLITGLMMAKMSLMTMAKSSPIGAFLADVSTSHQIHSIVMFTRINPNIYHLEMVPVEKISSSPMKMLHLLGQCLLAKTVAMMGIPGRRQKISSWN